MGHSNTLLDAEDVSGSEESDGTGISIIEVLTILLRRRRLIAATTAAAGVIAAGALYFWPPSFEAEASILPPHQQQSALASLAGGALGGLASAGMTSQLGLNSPADLYIGVLKSRTIADDIISQFHLQAIYKTRFLSDARKALANRASFSSGKDSLIKISVEDHDPKRAADIANGFIDELYKQNSRLAVTDGAQRRLFFQQELAREKDALEDAEIALEKTQHATGLVVPTGQAEVLVRSGAQLRAEIASREVRLQAMRSYATDENPQVQILKKEIGALQGQLNQLEASGGASSALEIPAGKLPEASLQYIRKLRDVKYHETLYELLAKQYEAARIDEAKEGPMIQVVDRAVVPDRKSWPPRILLTLASGMVGFIAACLWIILSHGLSIISRIPAYFVQIESFKDALRS